MHINELLRSAMERRASDLHLKAGSYPMMRVDGILVVAAEDKRLEREDTEASPPRSCRARSSSASSS